MKRFTKLAAASFAMMLAAAGAADAAGKVTISIGGAACLCYLPTVLAKQLGVHLGKVVSFSENGGITPYPMYASGAVMKSQAMDAVAPSLPVGQDETSVSVTITYEIR